MAIQSFTITGDLVVIYITYGFMLKVFFYSGIYLL